MHLEDRGGGEGRVYLAMDNIEVETTFAACGHGATEKQKKAWVSVPTSAFARPTPAARVYVNPLGCGDATRRTPRGICRCREAMLVGRKPMYLHVCVITLPPPPRKFGSLLVLVCRMAHAHVVTRIIVALGSGWER